jgi:phosphoribosylanthranilate isomerase
MIDSMSLKGSMKLKICGMRDADNIMQVAALRPDYMGFIFYEKSPRFVQHDFDIGDEFPSAIKRIGVFVKETTQTIVRQAKRLNLEYIQLHGDEIVSQCEALRAEGLKVIRVFSVDDDFDFKTTKSYKTVSDFFLFDTKGKYYGGNAQTFNWDILNQYNQEVPFFLSGGINPENVKQVANLKGMNIHALDVNSGVESSPGVKDIEKIKLLIDSIKN